MDDFLLDTNVISELMRPKPDAKVDQFLRNARNPWISTITLHELVYGAERASDPARRTQLLAWTARVAVQFAGQTILVDNAVAERSGRLRALALSQGHNASVIDAVIAASAQLRGLRVATRNTKDFRPFGVDLLDPWTQAQ